MIHLRVAGPDTHITSSVCAACPHSTAGCCTSPPPLDWSDLGRIVLRGGRDWLLAEIAEGRLVRAEGGLVIRRVKGVARDGGPRVAKCVYHGARGCTIAAERRAATCNYYVCESVLADAKDEAPRARELHGTTAALFAACDRALVARIRDDFPDGAPFGATFLDWLADATARELAHRSVDAADER